MTTEQSAVVSLLSAIAMANAPFLIQRRLLPPFSRAQVKSGAVRALEWLILYFLWMTVAYFLEGRTSTLVTTDWRIWTISSAFFAVLTFPGVTHCYLWRR
ncbi:DUF2818 family protein [Noviherbaspirillum sp.]|jgi:hypothetical protein|uniref:DUF2818 family protein n=1 Tax=Noviherbaspirillum sp. TaxID=1926288 RepID=UPI0025CF33FF|nr:DUF2818 family protein [Noviherbaspirillum sp.]